MEELRNPTILTFLALYMVACVAVGLACGVLSPARSPAPGRFAGR